MLSVWWFMFVLGVSAYHAEARITAEGCQVTPPETHCQIEWPVRDRWPHQERWVFDWHLMKCHVIFWADHCPAPKPETNNFATEKECMDACTGWA